MASLGLFALLVACGSATSKTRQASAPAPPDSAWFSRVRAEDFNGDGARDTLALQAFGPRPDSLTIRFTIRSRGREVFRTSWGSAYELIDAPLPEQPSLHEVGAYLRTRLETDFSSVRVAPLDTAIFTRIESPAIDCSESAFGCLAWYEQVRQAGPRRSSETAEEQYRRIRSMPIDTARVTALLEDAKRNAKTQIILQYGYETTMIVVWSALAQRFLTIEACC